MHPIARPLEMPFMCSNFDSYSTLLTAVMYATSCYIGPRYGGIRQNYYHYYYYFYFYWDVITDGI